MTAKEMLPNEAERNPIVSIVEGEAMADSRDVASFFKKAHKDVLRAIGNLHCSEDFRRRNFTPFKINDLTGESTSHVLMTKDGFAFLAMGFTGATAGKFKENYIRRFNEMEAQVRAGRVGIDVRDPTQLSKIALQLVDLNKELEGKLAEAQPKLQALERIAEADGSLCITDAAKTLQIQPKQLFGFMRGPAAWVYSRAGGSEVAYQAKLQAGLLEHKTTTVNRTDGSEKVVTQVRVTPKGLTILAEQFGSH